MESILFSRNGKLPRPIFDLYTHFSETVMISDRNEDSKNNKQFAIMKKVLLFSAYVCPHSAKHFVSLFVMWKIVFAFSLLGGLRTNIELFTSLIF